MIFALVRNPAGSMQSRTSEMQSNGATFTLLVVAAVVTVVLLNSAAGVGAGAGADYSSSCKRTCGNGSSVSYPFGFSNECVIQLGCMEETGEIKIDQFQVLNITRSSIFVSLPVQCDRSIESITPLFGPHYSPTPTNGLILRRCLAALKGCFESNWLVDTRVGNCSSNLTCFSANNTGFDVIGYEAVNGTGCKDIVTSVAVRDGNWLRVDTIELGWWIDGPSEEICAANASMENVKLVGRKSGTRCHCGDGFEGDGFVNGTGCRAALAGCGFLNYFSGHCRQTLRLGIVIGGLVTGALVITGLVVTCLFIHRRTTTLRNRMSVKHLLCQAGGNTIVPLYTYKDIERATGGFSERQRLGNGAYGTVYLGRRLHDNDLVAIKRMRHRDANSIDQVMNEIKLLSSISHPNLVRLLGCCIENGEQILVYEYMPNGTLAQHFTRERGRGLPWIVRLRIAAETARAIAYLHSETDPPIFHRDIKSNNILLDFEYNCKVADFGLSRLGTTETNDSHISTAPQGTPGYLDPQYHEEFHLSDKSDVYSFGVLLVEIITALKVVDFDRPKSEVNLAALALDRIGRGRIDEIIDPSIDPHRDAWTLTSIHKVAELAFRCLAYHRDMRPSMTEVAAELELMRHGGWVPSEETSTCIGSSAASTSGSSHGRSETSFSRDLSAKKAGKAIRTLSVHEYYWKHYDARNSTGRKEKIPTPAHDTAFSDRRSPSANALLRNMVP